MLDGIYVSKKGRVQQSNEYDLSCPAVETARCQMIPQASLWRFKDAIKAAYWGVGGSKCIIVETFVLLLIFLIFFKDKCRKIYWGKPKETAC